MTGLWVIVCGASGAGKDSVMDWAAQRLSGQANLVFSRRLVTRSAQPGSDHEEVNAAEFEALHDSGGLAWHWQAHGHQYGIPSRYASDVARGCVVVVNGSREHVIAIRPSSDVQVVQIVANSQNLFARLEKRGRDTPEAITLRMARNTQFASLPANCTIVNHSTLAEAGQELVNYLTTCTGTLAA